MAHIERFAPSPTGPLHLGHAFSAISAYEAAKATNGTFLLRIEDIDTTRCRPHWEQQIYEDLHWLGLSWPTPVLRQSDNLAAYTAALQSLTDRGLTYACTCTRAEIKAAAKTHIYGPDGLVYPGTCRTKNHPTTAPSAIRLNMEKAIRSLGGVDNLTFNDKGKTYHLNAETLLTTCGDIILKRKDLATSYHLSVVVDDAAQHITHVTRGTDLFEATQIHRLLQALLGLAVPAYHHHRLILDEHGKRLAKSDKSRAIAKFRAEGATPQDIRQMIGL